MRARFRAKGGLQAGLTLIELTVVVLIIGILTAIALVKLNQLNRKANEASAKADLGAVRSALSIYYGDMDGQFPVDLNVLTATSKYLGAMPAVSVPDYHAPNSTVRAFAAGCQPFMSVDDDFASAGWAYCATPGDPSFGVVLVNCTHTDTRATSWTSF